MGLREQEGFVPVGTYRVWYRIVLRSSMGLKKRNRLKESYQLALSFTFIVSPMRNAALPIVC